MKFKSFFAIAAMALMAIVSCEKPDEKVEAPASITASKDSLVFVAKDAPSQTVELTATRDWRVESIPEWVVLDKSDGKGSAKAQTITVSVEDNEGFDREGDVVFSIGIRKAAVKVKQAGSKGELVAEGDGTQNNPFNVMGVIKYVQELGADVASEEEVYVKGKVSQIEEAYSFSYGNGTFFITDDGTVDTPKFYCYRVYYLGGAKWTIVNPVLAVGDEVVVLSKVYNYKGNTPETVNLGSSKPGGPYNGKLYSLNGSTEAQVTEPDFSNAPEKTVAEFIAAADKNNFYKLHGTVSGFNSQYCSFDLKDESDSSIYVYSVANADEWKTKISNNAEVKLAGAYDYYESKKQHEVVSAWIMEVILHEQTEFEDKTIAEFIRLADENVAYRLTGTVSAFKTGVNKNNNPYMQFDLKDESGAVVTVYGFKAGQYDEWAEKISNRGTAKIHGVYKKYEKDGVVTHEVMETVIESFEPAPEQTVFEDKTVAEFIQLADKEVAYRLTGTVSSLSVNTEKQLMSFNLTDETETVKVYGFKAGQFAEWSEKLANGGTAVIHGTYDLYEKDGVKTHEVMETVIESFEAAAVVEEQAEGDGTLASPYNPLGAKAFIDDASFDSNKQVYVAGKISEIVYQFDAEHGTATFWISSDGSLTTQQFEAYTIKYLGGKAWLAGQKTVKVGDEVVLYGKLKKYNSTYETATGAYLYSLNGSTTDDSPIFGVESQTVNVGASATSALVNVTGNVAWTATSTCNLIGSNGTTGTSINGNGASPFSVEFPANDDTEAGKEYTVTVTTEAEVAVKSYTVTIKQGKKPAGGGEEKSLTLDLSKKTYGTATKDQVVWTTDAVVITANKNNAGTDANNYLGGDANNRTSSRFYKNSKVTFAPIDGVTITSMTFTATSNNYASDFAKSTWTNATAKATDSSVVVTPADGTLDIVAVIAGTCGFTSVKIDYIQ